MSSNEAVVIGAGFAGMAAAALLAKDDYDVTVVEKNDRPGGRAMVHEEEGYSFDMGPSWYMMLEAFERFFAEFGKTPDDFYETVRLNPSYRVFFNQDDIVDVHADLDQNMALFNELEPGGAKKLQKFLDQSQYQYEVAINDFIYREYESYKDILDLQLIIEGTKLRIFQSLDRFAKRFFSSVKARKLIEYSIAFVGGAPHISPAMYALLAHCDLNLGIWYPVGGYGSVMNAVYHLAEQQGATFQFDTNVKRIRIDGGIATGVSTDQGDIDADIVLNTADYWHGEMNMLPERYRTYRQRYWKKRVLAPASYLIFLGLDTKLDALVHHNLYLNPDWGAYFQQVFGSDTQWPDDPSYYVSCQSHTDPSMAPEGGENITILVLVAPGLQDTAEIRERYYNQIMDHFEQLVGVNVREHVVTKRIFAHNDFISHFNAYKGTSLGLAHTLRQTAIFRPHHRSKKVDNLYYAGHYTHPGVGVPVTLISSQIVHRLIEEDHGA